MRRLRSSWSQMVAMLFGEHCCVRHPRAMGSLLACLTSGLIAFADEPSTVPRCVDPRLTIEQFAAEPFR